MLFQQSAPQIKTSTKKRDSNNIFSTKSLGNSCFQVKQFKQKGEQLAPIITPLRNFATTSGWAKILSNTKNLE